eukprot:3144137-Heterocapsa_arctica.AAC.1
MPSKFITLRTLDFRSSQCSSVPSNFSGLAKPLRSTMELAVVIGVVDVAAAAVGPGVVTSGSASASTIC